MKDYTTPAQRKAKKAETIEQILTNTVYMPNSGIIKNLRKALDKWSSSDVFNLGLVLTFKKHDAVKDAREVDKILAKPVEEMKLFPEYKIEVWTEGQLFGVVKLENNGSIAIKRQTLDYSKIDGKGKCQFIIKELKKKCPSTYTYVIESV